jgi:hypothetical protein
MKQLFLVLADKEFEFCHIIMEKFVFLNDPGPGVYSLPRSIPKLVFEKFYWG